MTSDGLDENHELFCIVLSDSLEVNSSTTSNGSLNTIQNNSWFSSRPLLVIPRTFQLTHVDFQKTDIFGWHHSR